MAQKKDLNISPYYDDFDKDKNFYKVLFNPGRAVQARELTGLQSILQNQLESFGSHLFKDGSVVVPGNLVYDGQFYAVKLNPTTFGVDISLYLDQFIGKKITGSISGTTATIQHIELPSQGNVNDITIYVKYIDSNSDFEFTPFEDSEELTANENVVYGTTTILAGTPFASTISLNASSTGSAAFIGKGVYFVRGYFVQVSDQTLLLDYYTNTPSYRVGLKVNELIVNSKDDKSLFDNAKGFTNYAAPGADRLKISLTLTKKLLTDLNDTDFIELLRIENGKIKKIESKTDYNYFKDYLAERTYDESGDYSVRAFNPSLHNSLNNRLGNNGLFFEGNSTSEGNLPSDDLASLKISPGKAYVRGYDVEKNTTTILDVEKPRETEKITSINFPFEMGNLLRVNVVKGLPENTGIVTFYSQFKDTTNNEGSGTEIGNARVYNFSVTDAAHSNDATNWDLYLYDMQFNTVLTLNTAVSATDIPATSYVEGKSSGASGYAVADGNNTTSISLRQVSGTFAPKEKILVNGLEFSRTIENIRSYNSREIKSVAQEDGLGGNKFACNAVLERFLLRGISQININGNSATAGGASFNGLQADTTLMIEKGGTVPTYYRVASVANDKKSLTLAAVTNTDATNVFNGTLSDGTFNVFAAGSVIRNSNSASLYEELPHRNISSIDLSDSEINITVQSADFDASSPLSASTLAANIPNTDASDVSFEPFDEERYSLIDSTGNNVTLTSDNVIIASDGSTIEFLSGAANSDATFTLKKKNIRSKAKSYNRSQKIVIDYSKYPTSGSTAVGTGAAAVIDGLIYKKGYGLRVQDREISLNYPDVSQVLCVYESLDANPTSFDKITFSSTGAVGTDSIVGENIIGKSSKAVARIVEKVSGDNNSLNIVYLSEETFTLGESVTFEETNIDTTINAITFGNYKDITDSFTLDKGQRDQYYDYSRVVRNSGVQEPSKQLTIVFDYYSIPSGDNGDLYTVLSYDADRFTYDVPQIGPRGVRASDTLDFRPKVSVYDKTGNSGANANKSPFDFSNRSFTNQPDRIITPNEGTTLGYDFYLPRIDRLYLSKRGIFVLEKGVSASSPKAPVKNDAMMEIATIQLPPYLYNPQDAIIKLVDHRRFTMRDIGNIEGRVKNLERVTSLSLLELNTQTLQVQDSDGRNRFKSGFFVDDFRNYSRLNRSLSSVQINGVSGEMGPIISRNSLESQLAPATQIPDNAIDLNEDFTLLDPRVQKTGRAVTLQYEEIGWIEQSFATTTENVNPFNVVVYNGIVELNPEIDNWVRTIQLEDNNIQITTNLERTIERNLEINIENDIMNPVVTRTSGTTVQRIAGGGRDGTVLGTSVTSSQSTTSTTNTSFDQDVTVDTVSNTDTFIRNILVSQSDEEFMRSRNTEFSAFNLKPSTKYYQFLDGNGEVLVIPKLLEISKGSNLVNFGSTGTFQKGETVIGENSSGDQIISFRVAQLNHKYGPHANPTTTFTSNPYNNSESISSSYSTSSKFINIDTNSLCQSAQGLYSGYVEVGTKLIGQTSGAVAYVKDIRLISDIFGDLLGTFFLKDPNGRPVPSVRIGTGTKTFKLTSSPSNANGLPGSNEISFAETNYNSDGTLEQYRADVTEHTTNLTTTTETNLNGSFTTNLTTTNIHTQTTVADYYDPLAQSFTVGGNVEAPSEYDTSDDIDGAFLTSVDLFFATKDDGNAPVRVEVRTVQLGLPTMEIVGKPVILRPSDISVSSNGETPTNVKFQEPIFLSPGREYAIVIISAHSDAYTMWVATMGEKTVSTQSLPDAENVIYSKQFAMGSLYKSQNGSIWTANQYQDLKFKLYKANFVQSLGSITFYNPTLNESNGYVPTLRNNPIETIPQTGKLGITTIYSGNADGLDSGVFVPGRKITVNATGIGSTTISAHVVSTGSSVSGVSTISGGENYTSGTTVYQTESLTGSGEGFTLQIASVGTGNSITGITTVSQGSGYVEGEVVKIVNGSDKTGRDARLAIASNVDFDTLYLTNIQGSVDSFTTGIGVSYYNDDNVGTAATNITTRTSLNIVGLNGVDASVSTGEYFRVNHFDHGMYYGTNKVTIKDVESDVPFTTLTAEISATATEDISVSSSANFATFEGISVTSTNYGYLKIGNEVMKYNMNGNTINIVTRAIDGTRAVSHEKNSKVYKYELNGVSLLRINKTHDIPSNIENNMDEYYLKIERSSSADGIRPDRSDDAENKPQVSFNTKSSVGGMKVKASQNIVFGQIVPTYDAVTPGSDTSLSASIRTISATSVDGNEVPFIDQGFEPVAINALNTLSSLRMVASKDNESNSLSQLPRQKSLTTVLTLSSSNSTLSPIIYLDGARSEFYNSRINKPITDFTSDGRVNSILDDPHSAIYVSNTIPLANAATSLKVILSAYRDSSSDIRVLYSLVHQDSNEQSPSFELFPGYDNTSYTNDDGFSIVDPSKNSGLPDEMVNSNITNEFSEYQFTADNLSPFIGYTIKIIMSGTNQARPPRIKELRSIALR